MISKYGVSHNWSNGPIRNNTAKNNNSVSQKETVWLDSLQVPLRQHNVKGKSGKVYCVDGLNHISNTVYEFMGVFWHGHPDLFDSEAKHPMKKETFGELYEKTKERINDIQNNGYTIEAVWENGEKFK